MASTSTPTYKSVLPSGVSLPSINGKLEAGITVGIDPALADDTKLPVHVGIKAQFAAEHAAVWAIRRAQDMNMNDRVAREIFINGAVANILWGLCRMAGVSHDGDWVEATPITAATNEEVAEFKSIITEDSLAKALTLIVATKANWWTQNHHTGQGDLTGYPSKVYNAFYQSGATNQVITAIHAIGHWASTLYITSVAKIDGVRAVGPPLNDGTNTLTLSQDAQLRFSGYPAGCHRFVVALEGLKRMTRSPIIKVCPGMTDFSLVSERMLKIKKADAAYHLGAGYLHGSTDRVEVDTDMEGVLGRIGNYVNRFFGKSSLANSPHLSTDRVAGYPDYNPEFDKLLREFQTAASQNMRDALATISTQAINDPAEVEKLKQSFV